MCVSAVEATECSAYSIKQFSAFFQCLNSVLRILYADDVEVTKDTQPGLEGSAGGLYIGAGNNLDASSFFSGLIDDVRIYDRAVTP
ncbi:MAG: LamG-like jellyroll fold domain-containing protein [Planctomycetota bacterium]